MDIKPVQFPLPFKINCEAVQKLLRRMTFDDSLVWRRWRLEYLFLDTGLPHYRLFHADRLIGIVRLHAGHDLGYRDAELAAFLVGLGFDVKQCNVKIGGAKTPPEAGMAGLPYLFWWDQDSTRKRGRKGATSRVQSLATTAN